MTKRQKYGTIKIQCPLNDEMKLSDTDSETKMTLQRKIRNSKILVNYIKWPTIRKFVRRP